MASLVDTLTGAGLQPLDAQEIANAVALGTGLPTDLPALLQSARRGWWGMDAVDNAYKRLLDPEPGPATPGAPLDVGKAWDYQVGRLAEAGLLDTALARTMLARHIDWAQAGAPGARGTYYFASAEAVAKAYAADLPLPGRALAETYLGAWLDDIIKGGPGSGFFSGPLRHGRPGQRGGSASDMPEDLDDQPAPEELPDAGTDTNPGRTGFRKGWENYKLGMHIAYAGDFFPGDMPHHERYDRRIAFIDGMSQDERQDFFVSMALGREISFEVTNDEGIIAAVNAEDWDGVAEALDKWSEHGSLEPWNKGQVYRRQLYDIIASRLDVPHAEAALDAILTGDHEILKAKGMLGKKIDYEQIEKLGLDLHGAISLMEYGPTHAFRQAARQRVTEGPMASFWASNQRGGDAFLPDDPIDAEEKVVFNWTLIGGGTTNNWLRAGILQEFAGVDRSVVYWDRDAYGVILNDPDPNFAKTARFIYEDTQAFYAKKKKKPIKLYRGVNTEVTVRSPLEPWTKSAAVAKKYGRAAIFEREAAVEEIFFSYESQVGNWPPEERLVGKKEVTLLGLDWLYKKP